MSGGSGIPTATGDETAAWRARVDGCLALHGTWSPFAPGVEWSGDDLAKLIRESGLPFTCSICGGEP